MGGEAEGGAEAVEGWGGTGEVDTADIFEERGTVEPVLLDEEGVMEDDEALVEDAGLMVLLDPGAPSGFFGGGEGAAHTLDVGVVVADAADAEVAGEFVPTGL